MSDCVKILPIFSGDVTTEFAGPALVLNSGRIATTPGSQQTLIDVTVPAGETWRIRRYRFISRAYALFSAVADGVEFEAGKTSPASPDLGDNIINYQDYPAGSNIKVLFDQESNGPVSETEARLYYTVE